MSVRDAHDGAGKHGLDERRGVSSGGERRGGVGQRVHFEALVAMGEAGGGGGFEAESVDVSPEGMRLRTAYLPQVGDKLLCRFDGMGTEVMAEGEVIWCREEARGGEFGLRFVGYDDHAAEALRGMCAALSTQHGEAPAGGAPAIRGTRVRLHIEGLAAPMKARVREAAGGEIQVGSNLEFLRVGRPLEVEDVDHGAKRQAMIDHVRVEVDPATRVPQLVVALRMEGASKSQSQKSQSAARLDGAKADLAAGAIARAGTLPYGVRMPGAIDAAENVAGRDADAGRSMAPAVVGAAQEPHLPATAAGVSHAYSAGQDMAGESSSAEDTGGPDDEDRPARGAEALRNARDKAMAAGTRVAAAIGPALGGMGSRAKGAVSGLLATLRARRAAKADAQPGAPRRTTAPPPAGVLKADGRRLVRDRDESGSTTESPESVTPLRSKRKAALLGSVLGLLAILTLFAGYRIFGHMSNTPAPAATDAAATVAAIPPVPEAPAAAGPAASGVPTVAVPLFGATPLSTTEPVPPPAAAEPPGTAPPPAGAAAQEDGEGDDDSAEGDGAQGAPNKAGQKEWGQGTVKHPIVLKLKMDGEVASLTGAAGAMGFTVSVPGRRSLSSATELARKDKRIASIQVVNNPQGAEVSVQFKNGVPAYLARAKGSRLEIVLGSEGRKKVAKSTGDKSSKKKTDPKKTDSKKKTASSAKTATTKAKKPSAD